MPGFSGRMDLESLIIMWKGNGAMMIRRRMPIFILILSLILTMAMVPATAQTGSSENGTQAASGSGLKAFSDVPASHWAYHAISWMTGHQILAGKGNNRFDPDAAVTRDQFAKIMVLALQIKSDSDYAPSFRDVPRNSWAFRFIEAGKIYLTGWRSASGGQDLFKPYADAVREDMAVALVKALALQAAALSEPEIAAILEPFSDKETISPNLRKYVAIAVKDHIMNGIAKNDNTTAFDAQGTLTRAQASVLIYNALVTAGDKVSYDDLDKTAYDEGSAALSPARPATTVSAVTVGDKLAVSWKRIDSEHFQGYKVVLSKTDKTPAYPENGYYAWITDRDAVSVGIRADDSYNGGDIGGLLQSGTPYYLSITVVYDDVKVPGNVLTVTLP
jgi:hypothetical protein